LGDPDRPQHRHADARPEPAGAGAEERSFERGSARQGGQQGHVRRLGGRPQGGTMEREQATKFMYDLLRALLAKKGSDLFITHGFPPAMKVDGKMSPVSQTPLTNQHTSMLARSIMNDKQAAVFEATKECNFAINPAGIGRFRVNTFIQQGNVGIVCRVITVAIPKFDDLKLPPVLKDVIMTKRGLVLFVGGTGSGKSTSLAAMIGYRNENSHGHIITIEDPVEYV